MSHWSDVPRQGAPSLSAAGRLALRTFDKAFEEVTDLFATK
jgi:hypothetical protein